MASNDTRTGSTPGNQGGNASPSLQELIQALTAAQIAAMQAVQKPEPISPEEYARREYEADPANRLTRPVFQNGQPIQIKGCSDDTVQHLNAMKPGEYLGGAIKVTLRGRDQNEQLHITYPCATQNERLKIYTLVSSFSDMVQKIAQEQRAQAGAVAAR